MKSYSGKPLDTRRFLSTNYGIMLYPSEKERVYRLDLYTSYWKKS